VSAHVVDRLSAFLDSALPPAERQAVGEHLDGCQDCRNAFEELQALEDLVRDLPREMEPDDHPLDLVAGLRAQLKPRGRSRTPWWLAAAAAAAFVAFVPWVLVQRNREAIGSAPVLAERQEAKPAPAAPPASAAAPPEHGRHSGVEPQPERDMVRPEAGGAGGRANDVPRREKKAQEAPAPGRDESAATAPQKQDFAAPPPPAPPAAAPAMRAAAEEAFAQQAGPGAGLRRAQATSGNAAAEKRADAAKPIAPHEQPVAEAEALSVGTLHDEAADGRLARDVANAAPANEHYAAEGLSGSGAPAPSGAFARDADRSMLAEGKTKRHRQESFTSPDAARRSRDRWLAVAAQAATRAEADDASVAAIEAAAAAYRLAGADQDLVKLRGLVEEYEARPAAAESAYVQQVLERALHTKTP
jgi:anti-sigma factor RsiW